MILNLNNFFPQDGFVFRLKIANQKEIGLIKEVVEDGVKMYRDNDESMELEKKLFHLPRLSGALYGYVRLKSKFSAIPLLKKPLHKHPTNS